MLLMGKLFESTHTIVWPAGFIAKSWDKNDPVVSRTVSQKLSCIPTKTLWVHHLLFNGLIISSAFLSDWGCTPKVWAFSHKSCHNLCCVCVCTIGVKYKQPSLIIFKVVAQIWPLMVWRTGQSSRWSWDVVIRLKSTCLHSTVFTYEQQTSNMTTAIMFPYSIVRANGRIIP